MMSWVETPRIPLRNELEIIEFQVEAVRLDIKQASIREAELQVHSIVFRIMTPQKK